ncbi:unnamed protein product, partial [Symbiodinium microadriaticum]
DALVKDVEKKHGPLGNELLKVQRSLRKNIRENLDDDDDDRDKEEKQAKPKAKSKAKSKAKAKAASKSKAKSKPQPEIERSQEDVMSDAAELEKEEEIELTKVQEDEDADGNNVKNAKGKRKKKKAQKATMDAEAEDKPAKPVKRRLEFDEEAEADESACAEDVAQEQPEFEAKNDDADEARSFTLQPGPKVHENDDGLGIATIGVLFTGAFYVSPVTETRVAEVNAHAQKDRKIEANLKHGVHISWEKGNLGDIQDKHSGCS